MNFLLKKNNIDFTDQIILFPALYQFKNFKYYNKH